MRLDPSLADTWSAIARAPVAAPAARLVPPHTVVMFDHDWLANTIDDVKERSSA